MATSRESLSLIDKGPENLNRVSRHLHAAPCALWPWIDLEAADDRSDPKLAPPTPELCDHSPGRCNRCWMGYPQSCFPNWTERQVKKARIYDVVHNSTSKPCICYRVDMNDQGYFTRLKEIIVVDGNEDIAWNDLVHEQRSSDTRLRALFIENLSGPVLQMLGTKFNIEPFFWSSSLNRIPSRFQEGIEEKVGDHITITLPFLHSMSKHDGLQFGANKAMAPHTCDDDGFTHLGAQSTDRHTPLILVFSSQCLVLGFLSVHLVRNTNGGTIISYHPALNSPEITAKFLHERIHFSSRSIYWQSIFQKSQDPTFVLLVFIWHAVYAWDEALEHLDEHISALENRVISTTEMLIVRELNFIKSYRLHYMSLLDHCAKYVMFIKNTPNPAMDIISEEDRKTSAKLLNRECDNLLNEIERLSSELNMQERRLENTMELVLASISITGSRLLQHMAESAVQSISYSAMIFLPASFATGIFGMNINEINPGSKGTISQYVALTLALVILTVWITLAFRSKRMFPPGTSVFKRLAWPIVLLQTMFQR